MPAWPTGTAPFNFLLADYSLELEDNRYSFQPDIGPPIRRRKGSARTDTITGSINWTWTEKDVAVAFYTDDLEDGSLPFTAPHPETGITTTFVFDKPMSFAPEQQKVKAKMALRVLG